MSVISRLKSRDLLLEQFPILRPENPKYKWLVLSSVMIATFMAVLDATVVNVALSKLMAFFGVSVDRIEWVLTAYLLVFGVMLPTSGWLADNLGHKRVFLFGLILFTFGSFLCSLASSFEILIAFRVLQGSGAGLLMPIGLAILTREFPPEKRGIALGFWTVAASASVSLGPTLGGYLIDKYSWRTIFDVNVPIGIFALFILFIVLRELKSETRRPFDLIGFISLTTFLTSLLLALASGNSAWNTGGWTSTFILTCFALSAIGLVFFLVTEFSVDNPLIELSLFRNFNFALSNVVLFLFGVGMFGSVFLLPIYLQDSLGYTPLQAGLMFLPVGFIQGLAAPLAGLFSDRFSPKIPAFIGMVLMGWTLYEFSYLSFLSEKSQIMLPLYIRGIALGILFAPLTTLAISEISNRKMAQASGLFNVIRQIGGSFGVALFGTILTRKTIYHTDIYGQQMNTGSAIYKLTIMKLQHVAIDRVGGTLADGLARAKALLVMFINEQAFISAVDDVFLIAAVIIFVGAIPILFLRTRHMKEARLRAAAASAPPATEKGQKT